METTASEASYTSIPTRRDTALHNCELSHIDIPLTTSCRLLPAVSLTAVDHLGRDNTRVVCRAKVIARGV